MLAPEPTPATWTRNGTSLRNVESLLNGIDDEQRAHPSMMSISDASDEIRSRKQAHALSIVRAERRALTLEDGLAAGWQGPGWQAQPAGLRSISPLVGAEAERLAAETE